MTHQVFISHSAKNKAVADTILEKLEDAGVGCWIAPRDIQPGDSWGGAILRAIGACKILVVILSENSNASHQVLREVERAVQKNVTIIPFRIEEITPSDDLEYFLSTTHWLDAYGGDFQRHLQELVTTATNILAQHGIAPSLSKPSASSIPPTPPELSPSEPEISSSQAAEPAAEPELEAFSAEPEVDTTTIDIPTIGPTGPGDNQDSKTQEEEANQIKEQSSPAAESPPAVPKQKLEPALGVAKQRNRGNKQRFEPSLTASPEESTSPVEELDSHESATLEALETLEETLEETLPPGDATSAEVEQEIHAEAETVVELETDGGASFAPSSHQQDESAQSDEEVTELPDVSESADTERASEELTHLPADQHTATKSGPIMLIGLLLLGLAGAGWYFTQGKPTSSTVQETTASDSIPSSNNQAQPQGDSESSSAVAGSTDTATATGTGTDTGSNTESNVANGEEPTEQNSDTPAATPSETTTDEVAELTPEEAEALEQAAAQAAEEAAKQRAAEEARQQAIAAAKADFDSIAQQAEGGDVEAVLALAELYERGNLVVKADPQAALELYRQASDAGNAAGQYAVAQNLLKDGAQSTDVPQAIELLDAAAAQSHVPALNELASIFEKGEIVERNYERAAELYLQAAEQNDALAQRSLGVFYDFGLGVAQDAEQALKWYDMAAELGDSKAAFYAEQLRNKEASEADQ